MVYQPLSSELLNFIDIFVRLFVVIDPFGGMVLFVALTSSMDDKAKRTVTNDAVIYGGLILIFFAVFGSYILSFFGISIAALEIAGGLIHLIIGIEMVREGDRPKSMGGNETSHDIGIVPFATPFIAGPGAISLVIILMGNGLFKNPVNDGFTLSSIVIVMLIIFVFFVFSVKINEIMGEKVLKVLTRIFGLLVAGFAVQYFINAFVLMGLKV